MVYILKMSSELFRKCCKCAAIPMHDETISYHRFPKPGKTNILRARAWAVYCWPEKDWTSLHSLTELHKSHKMLCGRHFEESCFIDSNKRRLSKFSVPGHSEYVKDLMDKLRNEESLQNTATEMIESSIVPSEPVAGSSGQAGSLYQEMTPVLPTMEESSIVPPEPVAGPSGYTLCQEKTPVLPTMEESIWTDKTMDSIRYKMRNVLHSTQYCGLCMDIEDDMSAVGERFEIVMNSQTHNITLKGIIEAVFCNVKIDNVLINSLICKGCMEKLIQTYIFILQTVDTAKLITRYIQDMWAKTATMFKHMYKSNISNAVVILEKCLDKEKGFINDTEESTDCTDEEDTVDNTVCDENTTACKLKKTYGSSIFKCGSCNMRLPTIELLKQHKLEHESLKCNMCLKTFETEKYFIEHCKLHSEVKCRICDRIVTEELVEHLRNEHRNCVHVCDQCDSVLHSFRDLQMHKTVQHSSSDVSVCVTCLKFLSMEDSKTHKCRFACQDCNEAPCMHSKYLESVRIQNANYCTRIKCPDCDYVCGNKSMLLIHAKQVHLEHNYLIDKCSKYFKCKLKLISNLNKSHPELVCKYCDVQFIDVSKYENHSKYCKVATRDFWCHMCPASFDDRVKLAEHKAKRHNSDEIFPCNICKIKFRRNNLRDKHMIEKHNLLGIPDINIKGVQHLEDSHERIDSKQLAVQGTDSKFRCEICNNEYESIRQYRDHYYNHVRTKVSCYICGKQMRSKQLKTHLTTHSARREICEICGKAYKTVSLLEKHQKLHSDGVPCSKCKKLINPSDMERHYNVHRKREKAVLMRQCDECEYRTKSKVLLENHIERVHPRAVPHMCQVCGVTFANKLSWRRHARRHRDHVQCDICMKTLVSRGALRVHMRIHTGEKPYACNICGQKFRTSVTKNIHRNRHFDRSHQCPHCAKMFYNFKDVRKHVAHVHWKRRRPPVAAELNGADNVPEARFPLSTE